MQTTYHHLVPLSWNLGALTSWNLLGHSRPVTGLIYLYYECVFVTLFIQHAGRVRHVILSSMTRPHFATIFHKGLDFKKFGHRMHVSIFSATLSETFLILKRIRWDIMVQVHRYYGTVTQVLWYRYTGFMVQVHRYYGTGTQVLWYSYTDIMVQVHRYYGTGTRVLWYMYTDIMVQVHRYYGTGTRVLWYRYKGIMVQVHWYYGTGTQVLWYRYAGIHVKYALFFSGFKENLIFSAYCRKIM